MILFSYAIDPPSPSSSSNFSLVQLISRDKLIGLNYIDWIYTIIITLRYEEKEYVMDEMVPKEP